MTNAEIGENALNEMYNFIMAGISAGTAALDGKIGTVVSVKMGGVDIAKDQLDNIDENHYEGIGRFVGDAIGVISGFGIAKLVTEMSIGWKASTAFGSGWGIAEMKLGDTFANLFNTYVANADAFYTKILTDQDYANQVWQGLKSNGLANAVDYFDPNHDGNVSSQDIIDGYKKLFSPPPAFGSAEFSIQYSTTSPYQIKIDTPSDDLYYKSVIEQVLNSNLFSKFTLNNQSFDIRDLTPEEKQRLEELGFIVYDPNNLPYDPNNIIPNTPTDPNTNPADGHPFDPERFDPPRRDPLVLDMNKDGLISTVSLADSTAFFDLTGDGIKEKVGWVSASEGIVAFDKNGNGKIDGIGEVFGTATTSGFAELRLLQTAIMTE